MSWLDYLIISIIVISAGVSVFRGFIREVLSLVSWVVAIWVAFYFYAELSPLLTDYVSNPKIRQYLAMLILFVVTLILGALVNNLIGKVVDVTGLTGTDRALGTVFGALRGIAIVTIMIFIGQNMQFNQTDWWKQSSLVGNFEPLVAWAHTQIPNNIDIDQYINKLP